VSQTKVRCRLLCLCYNVSRSRVGTGWHGRIQVSGKAFYLIMIFASFGRAGLKILPAALLFILISTNSFAATDELLARPSLSDGFALLYNLDFDRAHRLFATYEQQNPDDPMGPVCDAAGFLFSEFNRLGILESQFYENDNAFDGRKKQSPDPLVRDRFDAVLATAERLAKAKLERNSNNRDGLLAMTLSAGLKADYSALIEKKNLASLSLTKDASRWAQQLLAADPNCYDAYVATGVSKYIIGSMAAPVRWLLRIGGVNGDKSAGINELQMTAEKGQYLAPFARILLAIAYVREKDKPRARELLTGLRQEFPNNSLFTREIARLDGVKPSPSTP
jgi:hypothetical protein